MTLSPTTTLPKPLQWLFALMLLLAPGAFTSGGALHAAVADQVDTAMTTINTKTDPGNAKMAPVMTETNKTAGWLIWLLWLVVPLLMMGILIPWGVMEARKGEMEAARKIFIATALGVIFYFGVLTIFFV